VKTSKWGVAALAVVLAGSAYVGADEPVKPSGSAEKPAAAGTSEAAATRTVRLTKPWKDMTSLSEEQKSKINAIHRKAIAEIKAIELRETDEIMALLDDAQKAELKAMTEKQAATRKAKPRATKARKAEAEAPE
jgi:hypothetical protein